MSDLALAGAADRDIARRATHATTFRHGLMGEVLKGADVYENLRPEFERLANRQPGTVVFQTPPLLSVWARHFLPARSGSFATVIVKHENRPILIWPLFVEQRGLFCVASGAGAPIGQYDEVLLDSECEASLAIEAAIDALKKAVRADLIVLERVRADSILRLALHDAPPLRWSEGAPYTDLSAGVAPVMTSMKARASRQQKRRVQRFNAQGRAAFAVAANAEQSEAWMVEALALKREWLRATGRLSRAFLRPEFAECLAELAATLSRRDASPRLVVSKLSLDDRTAAIEVGICHNQTYHLYLGAFAKECARLGPGNILTQKVLDWCVENGICRYDMLAPRSRNKAEWQTGEVAVLDFVLPLTLRGRLYATVLKHAHPLLRRAFYALPLPARSAVTGMALKM